MRRADSVLSPCVEVNGKLLADVSGDEVEAYLLAGGLVSPNENPLEAPAHQCCSH